jgi:hypothetical protein
MPACIMATENDENIVRLYLIDPVSECPPGAEGNAANYPRVGVRVTITTMILTT